jgi:hypothetical protein
MEMGKEMKMFARAQRPAKPRPAPAEPKQWWQDGWDKVRAAYPIGRQFEYLGRKMVVAHYIWTKRADKEFSNEFTEYLPMTPCLIAEYADDHGKLHEWQFTVQMMPLLLTAEPQAIQENK